VFTDPALKDGNPDLLDGGKVFVEICCLISLAAWAWRIRLRGRGLRQFPTAASVPLEQK
jgi:hypothetical protein